jgi:hypothetical protein
MYVPNARGLAHCLLIKHVNVLTKSYLSPHGPQTVGD